MNPIPDTTASAAAQREAEHLAAALTPRLLGRGFAIVPPTREPSHMVHAPYALLPRPVRAWQGWGRLGRSPGRRVSFAVSPADQPRLPTRARLVP